MSRSLLALILAICAALPASAVADTPQFSFTSHIEVNGEPFTGTGLLKFVITDAGGDVTLWSHDGSSVDGMETNSSSAIETDVTGGYLSVNIGDTATTGMATLHPVVFNTTDRLFLRTWFNDSVHGFERLLPDQQIVGVSALGLTATEDFTIYVDADDGNNRLTGLTAQTAKQSIQAAVNALPRDLRCNAKIKVLPGAYHEQVSVADVDVLPGKYLTIEGDTTWNTGSMGSPNVRITGETPEGQQSYRSFAILAQGCSYLRLRGLLLDSALANGLALVRCSDFEVIGCKVLTNGQDGIRIDSGSTGLVEQCTAATNLRAGISIQSSTCFFSEAVVTDSNDAAGIEVTGSSNLTVSYTTLASRMNGGPGLSVSDHSNVRFAAPYAGIYSGNAAEGIHIDTQSFIDSGGNYAAHSFAGNGGEGSILLENGGASCNE